MKATETALADLRQRRPEWRPWLSVVEEMLRDAECPAWDAAVPTIGHAASGTTPLLDGAVIAVDRRCVHSLLQRLIRVASRNGTPQMVTLRTVLNADLEALTLFRASVCRDDAPVAEAAASCDADPAALEAMIALICTPFLLACNRRLAGGISPAWVEGYCPLCGAWPAFVEARGIERNRFFRCGRCGSEWHARPLRCPYCSVDDHNALVSLVPESGGLNAVIEGCRACLGYVKTFTRLQGCPPSLVMLDDLASVQLDVAALEQGYIRPRDAGHPLDVTVTASAAGKRLFTWNA